MHLPKARLPACHGGVAEDVHGLVAGHAGPAGAVRRQHSVNQVPFYFRGALFATMHSPVPISSIHSPPFRTFGPPGGVGPGLTLRQSGRPPPLHAAIPFLEAQGTRPLPTRQGLEVVWQPGAQGLQQALPRNHFLQPGAIALQHALRLVHELEKPGEPSHGKAQSRE